MQRAYKAETLGDTRSRVRTGWAVSLVTWSWKDYQTKRHWAVKVITRIVGINSVIWTI